MFRNFQFKLMVALFVAGVAVMFQNMELDAADKNEIAEKVVILTKSRQEVYTFLSKLENLPLWFPNVKQISALDSKSETAVGKKYRQQGTFLFGLGETQTVLTLSSVQPPLVLEFYSDNLIKEINHIEFTSISANKTKVEWKIYSMRKTILFKYTIGMLYQFYYGQLLREALFSLQFLLKK